MDSDKLSTRRSQFVNNNSCCSCRCCCPGCVCKNHDVHKYPNKISKPSKSQEKSKARSPSKTRDISQKPVSTLCSNNVSSQPVRKSNIKRRPKPKPRRWSRCSVLFCTCLKKKRSSNETRQSNIYEPSNKCHRSPTSTTYEPRCKFRATDRVSNENVAKRDGNEDRRGNENIVRTVSFETIPLVPKKTEPCAKKKKSSHDREKKRRHSKCGDKKCKLKRKSRANANVQSSKKTRHGVTKSKDRTLEKKKRSQKCVDRHTSNQVLLVSQATDKPSGEVCCCNVSTEAARLTNKRSCYLDWPNESCCKGLNFPSVCDGSRPVKKFDRAKKKHTVMGTIFEVIFWPCSCWTSCNACK